MKIDSLFISDVHLGSRGSNSNELIEVLKKYEPENIFIIGDFIDCQGSVWVELVERKEKNEEERNG